MPDPDPLWTKADLARWLGYSEATVQTKLSRAPDSLPPRIRACGIPRWDPVACHVWAAEQSRPVVAASARKRGRPRVIVSPASPPSP